MRTTLDLDEDILGAAKQIAAARGVTTGKVVSQLVREALRPKDPPRFRNGIELIPHREGEPPLTLERVNELRDDEW